MTKAIGIRVTGSHDNKVYFPDFLKACNGLLELLAEVDKAISATHKPTVEWHLKTLSYASPALVEVEGETKEDQPDNRAAIVDMTVRGVDSLRKTSARPLWYSDRALEVAKEMTELIQNGVKSLEVVTDGFGVEYQASILDNVKIIVTPGKQMYGSIEGRIERMNSHEEFSFYLYEPILSRRIRCELMDAKDLKLKARVISLYESAVMVSGLLSTNINGETTSAKISSIEPKEVVALLKDASEVTGIWDFTGGESPTDYIRRMRDDS